MIFCLIQSGNFWAYPKLFGHGSKSDILYWNVVFDLVQKVSDLNRKVLVLTKKNGPVQNNFGRSENVPFKRKKDTGYFEWE